MHADRVAETVPQAHREQAATVSPHPIAAIYARKSTEQTGTDADAKSVARQIENATAFAVAKSWQIADEHVYSDDAISGAETRKLVNRQRLIDVIDAGDPPFQILILRDASRFSRRDGDEAFGELKRIAQAGIAIWFYQDGTRFTFGSFGENVVGFVRAEMNAEYRRQVAQWTREAMIRKAKAGYVCGGKTYGYDNHRVEGHVERRINPAEAAVVRRIFGLSASGWGYSHISKELNTEQTSAPLPRRKHATVHGQQLPPGWGPSTIHAVLHRELYRGVVLWGQTRKRDASGHTAVTNRPETEWVRVIRPELRIVPEATWSAVHDRLSQIGARLNAESGGSVRRSRDIDSKYLLSGFARCAHCGGSLCALSRNSGRLRAYGCLAHSKRGANVCANALVLPVDRVEAAVVAALTRDALHPQVVRAILDRIFEALQPDTAATTVAALKQDLRALDSKISNLTVAVESGAALAPLVAQLQIRQAERERLLASIASAETRSHLQVDRQTIERDVLAELAEWRRDLAANGRHVLREALIGPLRFTQDGKKYRFEGTLRTGDLIAGLIGQSTFMASPRGFDKGWTTRFSGIAA